MDTRSKILPLEEAAENAAQWAAAGERVALLVAWFDPMTADSAGSAARLAAGGARVFVLLADPPQPILDRDSRARLAASLADVTCVSNLSGGDLPGALALFPGAALLDDRDAEAHRRHALYRHVHARQQGC